ncbi:primosomal replication protein [Vibrio parahaemolyticus]|uniref:primosomal replication protein n=1 Tax=Vibrio mediterranei TaxID=689 RepID=UPI0040677A73
MNIAQLKSRLGELKTQAHSFDRQHIGQGHRYFDQHLFDASGYKLTPCVEEAERNLVNALTNINNCRGDVSSVEFLLERFSSQLEALERVLADIPISSRQTLNNKPLTELRADLKQHKAWEQRLCQLVREKELNMDASGQSKQDLIATEQRLQRCRSAINAIKYAISQRMKFI